MSDAHPSTERLEALVLTATELAHLASCPQCRIDRRLLTGDHEVDATGFDVARPLLEQAMRSASASLVTAWRSARSHVSDPASPPDLLPAGTRVGAYTVDALLGVGGMAVVYRVVHAGLGTAHALKVLTAPGAQVRQRLLREARLQGRLRHEHVVAVTDVVEVSGAPALVLDYVVGPSLDRLLGAGPLPIGEADALAQDLLSGMAAAHAAGFVHRDLKPSNVLVEVTPDRLVARVSDFGLAKTVGPTRLDGIETRSGGMLGTLLYMAPEQIRDPRHADPRSDVFSLGALLYELVAGHRCFAGVDVVDIVQRVSAAVRDPLPEGVPLRMRRAIDQALTVSPDARPADAAALRAMWLDGRTPSTWTWTPRRLDEVHALHAPTLLPDAAPHEGPFPGCDTLPAEVDAFVGRQLDLLELDRLLAAHQLVCVTGPGGAGKTRLTTRFAWSRGRSWQGGVFFADLTAARSAGGVAYSVARALDVPLGRDVDIARVGLALAARGRCLLVVDNLEQVADAARDALAQWLSAAPEASILATSRVDLHLGAALSLHPLPAADGAALFVARAATARPGFSLDDAERERVDQLVALLDGLPLAIELAAARVRVMTPAQIVARMTDRFRLLRGGGDDRHATLRSAIEWSWHLLSEPDQQGLAQLAVFDGGFDLAAAEAVLDVGGDAWPEDVLQALVEASLVRSIEARFGLLVSVREFAASHLDDGGAAERRHGAHYAALGGQERIADLDRSLGAERRRAYGADLDNFVVACQRAVQRGDGAAAVATLRAAWAVLETRGPYTVAASLADSVRRSPGLTRADAASAAHLAGRIRHLAGDTNQAASDFADALALYGDAAPAALLCDLGRMEVDTGALNDARGHLDAAVAAAAGAGDRVTEGKALGTLGVALDFLGEAEVALAAYEASLAAHREVGNRRAEGAILTSVGSFHGQRGDAVKARAFTEAAVAAHRETGDERLEAQALANLAIVRAMEGQRDEARAIYERVLELHLRVGDLAGSGSVLNNLASLLSADGHQRDARRFAERAVATHRRVGNRRALGGALVLLAEIVSADDPTAALAMLAEAEEVLAVLDQPAWLVPVHGMRARVQTQLGDLDGARGSLHLLDALGGSHDSPFGAHIERIRALVDEA